MRSVIDMVRIHSLTPVYLSYAHDPVRSFTFTCPLENNNFPSKQPISIIQAPFDYYSPGAVLLVLYIKLLRACTKDLLYYA